MRGADMWSDYWCDPASGAETSASFGGTDPQTRAVMDRVWHDFARALPRRGRVLDLATGGGIVLATIRSVRPDLVLTGVDGAARLPKAPRGASIEAGIACELLPFPDAAFDAVTSRFGIEYAELESAASEAARVLRPQGKLRFLLHHRDSALLRHNLARLEALRWAARESGYLATAANLARARRFAGLPTPAQLRGGPEEARRRFPGQPAAWEVLTAIVQTLDRGAAHPPRETMDALATLEHLADGEIGRLEALARAACDAGRVDSLRQTLAAGGVLTEPAVLVTTSAAGAVLAWQLDGAKSR